MRLAVVTAFLLLVCILDTVTARFHHPAFKCISYPDEPCDRGWSQINAKRCAKVFEIKKTFSDAQDYCRNIEGGDLVSIHNEKEMMKVFCISARTMHYHRNTFWIGLRKTGNQRTGRWFEYTDGSEFKYTKWHHGEPSNSGGKEHCVVSNYKKWGYWNDTHCSDKKYFMCAKKK